MADEVIYRGYNEEIDVNMVPGGPMSVWHSSQYDELRKLRVNLYNGKSLQYLGSGVTVSLSVRKNDGNIIESSSSNVIRIVEENPWGEGSAPWRFIEINTTQQMTACVGKNICEIVVYETVSGETSRVGSANFILEVEKDPLAGGIHSDSEIDDLEEMVKEALDGTTLGDLGDVSISGKQEGDSLRYDPTSQEWRNVRVYAKDVEVPANTTLFDESFTLKSSDIGKDIRIYVYRNSFSAAAPVNVSGSPRTNYFDVYVTMEAESYVSHWRIELEVCEKESTHPSEAPLPDTVWGWHLKAQLSSGGGGSESLSGLTDVSLSQGYQQHPGRSLMLKRLSHSGSDQYKWQDGDLFIDFYDDNYPSQSQYGTKLQAGQSTLVITDDAFKDGYDVYDMEYPFMQIYTTKQGLAPYSKVIDGVSGTLTLKFVPQSEDVTVFVRLVMSSPYNYRKYD